MNQVERILNSDAPIQTVGKTHYKGQPPVYRNLEHLPGAAPRFVKVSKGIPFVRVS